MAAQFAVDLIFKSLGAGKLSEAADKLNGVDTAAKKAQSSADQLTAAITKQKTANAQLAGNLRQLKVEYDKLTAAAKESAAAGGKGFDKETVSRLRGLSTEIGRTREALNAGKTALGGNQAALAAIGPAAKGAAIGVKGLGVAFNAALGPIGAVLAGVAGLTAAFKTISAQDFAEAKVKTLGVNATDLKDRLEGVSRELQGQASVTQLTAASYDVASAGFNDAASAAEILKAASLGATGGFADLNTVANATTSVLNAYGMSAASAGTLVDQFVQTQNDGKIVVAEYAREIGKVAAAAAGLGVPLAEVNAVIAQSTAAGVKGEVAFTGLKTALARFASGEAQKALEGTGVSISAASLEAEGLVGTFKKLQAAGLDTGQIFKALGTEAAPALLPVLNNMEKFEQLLENQKNAAGVAAQAQATAAGTIQGAWTRVSNAVQNIFADQNELGKIIRAVLLMAAATVEALGVAFELVLSPIRALIGAIGGFAKAMGFVGDAEAMLNDFTKVWFDVMDAVSLTADIIIQSGERWGNFLGGMISNVAGWFSSLWGGISQGASGVTGSITGAFADAFNAVSGMISRFWNGLPGWLRGALSMAGDAVGGIAKAVGSVVQNAIGSVQNEIAFAVNSAKGSSTGAFSGITGSGTPTAQSFSPTTGGGGGKGGGGGGGGGGGKGGGVDKAAQEAAKAAEQEAKRLASARELLTLAQAELGIKQALNPIAEAQLESAEQVRKINAEYAEKIAEATSQETKKVLEQAKGIELQLEEVSLQKELADLKESAVGSIQDEIEMLQAKLNGTEKELTMQREIAKLKAAGVSGGEAESLVKTKAALEAQFETQEKVKSSAEGLADSISSSLTGSLRGLIDGSMTAEEALSNAFEGIANAFLDMAMQMIQEWIKMQIMGLVGSMFGGGISGSFFGGGMANSGGLNLGGIQSYSGVGASTRLADGGFISSPTQATVGEGGSNEYVIPENKMGSAMQRWNSGMRGDSVTGGADPTGESDKGWLMAEQAPQINIEGGIMQFNDSNYIRQDQLPSIISQAGQQGEKRALMKLRSSPAARRRIGL